MRSYVHTFSEATLFLHVHTCARVCSCRAGCVFLYYVCVDCTTVVIKPLALVYVDSVYLVQVDLSSYEYAVVIICFVLHGFGLRARAAS